ncbi:unnamed protein product [Cylicocyclus nassatus]|uniref:Uncharacterized protein n=1 Tax=Cylicocyclus nassatus TaxID=53992 RepID=A0AA36MC94_CYLNA|nr:unnamed protein product [Cylicocyclus nassatus]
MTSALVKATAPKRNPLYCHKLCCYLGRSISHQVTATIREPQEIIASGKLQRPGCASNGGGGRKVWRVKQY